MVQFDFSRVLNRALKHYERGFLYYFLLMISTTIAAGAVVFAGLVIGAFVIGAADAANESLHLSSFASTLPGILIILFTVGLAMVLGVLVRGMYFELTNQLFQDYDPDLSSALSWTGYHFLDYLGLMVLMGFGIFFASMAFIVPGIILACVWVLAPYVIAREDKGSIAALIRSWHLTKRAFGWVFLTLFAYVMVICLVGWIPLLNMLLALVFAPFIFPLIASLYDELRWIEADYVTQMPHVEEIQEEKFEESTKKSVKKRSYTRKTKLDKNE